MSEQIAMPLPAPTRIGKMPVEPIVRAAHIEGEYRFTATRAWGAGPCILWCLLNPSKADGRRDDPTMQRMMGFSYRWGFGSMVVVNVYPFISAHPKEMLAWRKTWGITDSKTLWDWLANMETVQEQIAASTKHVAAWGNGVNREDLAQFLDEIEMIWDEKKHDATRHPIAWHCIGTTISGAPVHPLARGKSRIPDDAVLKPWKAAR